MSDDSNKKKGIRGERIRQLIAAGSGLGIASFALLHLGGHLAAPVSVGAANEILFAAREAYQHPAVETLLLGSLILHSGAALSALRVQRMNLFKATGLFLLASVPVHVAATRVIPYSFGTPVDLRFVRTTMDAAAGHPVVARLFFPYYVALGTSGLFHGLVGVAKALRRLTGFKTDAWVYNPTATRRVFGISLAAMLATVLAINGYAGDWNGSDWTFVDAATRVQWADLHHATYKIFSFGLL
ncbi:UNVERIFIED_CONTAM: hypothetical protein HDU68_008995 [Siphonaria sp. JEL0065]|nr:hypothetical protein HDU68_008995 [Siphonaria sp. JEL0065]